MRLHDRYLFRELLTPLAFCLGGFLIFGFFIFFFTQLETIQDRKLAPAETLEFCSASLPGFLGPILPLLLLLALLYALTQHARYNELTALRAAGVSLWRVCLPYFATGLVATAVSFGLNEVLVPRCDQWAAQILDRHAVAGKSAPAADRDASHFYNARARRLWRFASYDERNSVFQKLTITWTLADGSWKAIEAERAVRTNGVWTFFGVHLFKRSAAPHAPLVPDGATNMIALAAFDETPEQIHLLLRFADSKVLRASGIADIPLGELWKFMRDNPGISPSDLQEVRTKFHGRLATPWTCFVVVLVAIPFGAQSGRRNLFVGVAGSIFIGFAYFVLQRVSYALGINGQLPGWLAAWLPNLLFALTGIVLTLRVR